MGELLRRLTSRYSAIKQNANFIQKILREQNFEKSESKDMEKFYEIFNLNKNVHVVSKYKVKAKKDGVDFVKNLIVYYHINNENQKIVLHEDSNGIIINVKVEKSEINTINGINHFDSVKILKE